MSWRRAAAISPASSSGPCTSGFRITKPSWRSDALHSIEPSITQEEIDEEIAQWKAEKAEARDRANRS